MLFRKPVKDEWLRVISNGAIIKASWDWSESFFTQHKDVYEFVTVEVTVVEPPPPPEVRYHNFYPSGNTPFHPGYKTRAEADRGASSTHNRIACIKVTEGQFDD